MSTSSLAESSPEDVPTVLVVGHEATVTEEARRMCIAAGGGFREASTLHENSSTASGPAALQSELRRVCGLVRERRGAINRA